MNTEKSFEECKDEVAQSRAYDNWDDMAEMEYSINMSAWEFLLKATDEAAELYASQFKQERVEKPDYVSIVSDYFNGGSADTVTLYEVSKFLEKICTPLQARIKELEQEIDRLKG